jgi:hypothetical protein
MPLRPPVLVNRFIQLVGSGLGKGEADRFGLHLTRPGEASTGLADGSAMNRIDTHLIAAGELRSQRGVAGFR